MKLLCEVIRVGASILISIIDVNILLSYTSEYTKFNRTYYDVKHKRIIYGIG